MQPSTHELQGIWQLDVPVKIYFFLWKIANNALPLNAKRNRIFPNTSPRCVFCHDQDEKVTHLFLQCSFTQAVWFGSKMGLHTTQMQNLRVNQWMRLLIFDKKGDKDKLEDSSIFCIGILWLIWKHCV